MNQFANCISRYKQLILDELTSAHILCWVAGGSVRDYFLGKPVNTDHDLFFPDERNYNLAKEYFTAKGCEVIWDSDNGMKLVYEGKKYDLVKHFFKNPKETIDNFDFTVSMFAVDINQVYHGETSFIDLAKRQLMFNKITYPASSLKRAFRYYDKGFRMCAEEMMKLCLSIQDMPKKETTQSETEDSEDISSGELRGFFTGID